jgi:uncharacterized delta-60 repeat protein
VIVTYDDPDGVSVGSIGRDDIAVAREGAGPLTVTGVTVAPADDGTSATATYALAAPGGTWDLADNGLYAVTVTAGQVLDAGGQAVAGGVGGAFAVEIPAPQPTIDPTFGGAAPTPRPTPTPTPTPTPAPPPPPPVSTGFVTEATVTQSDGKILLAGRRRVAGGNSQYVLKRLNPDGTVDRSFGRGGETVSSGDASEAAYAIALDENGDIFIAGVRDGDMALTRFRSNGLPEARFGTAGQVVIDAGGTDIAYGLAIAADRSLVLGGASDGKFAVARLLADGRPDAAFGGDGVVSFDPTAGGGESVVGGVAVTSDGKAIAAGTSGSAVVAVRLNADGTPDQTFGGGGGATVAGLRARTDLNRQDYTVGVTVDADGYVLVANQAGSGSDRDFGVVRLDPTGERDAAFGASGLVTADFGGDDDADAVLVQASGEVLLVGTTDAGGNAKTAVAAFDAVGAPIREFGTAGKFTTDVGVTSPARALNVRALVLRAFANLQPNGQLLVGAADEGPRGTATARCAG